MFADKKSENYSIQQIGIYRESTEKNFSFWYCYTNTKVDMHTVYFYLCNCKYHIWPGFFMHLFEEEEIFC